LLLFLIYELLVDPLFWNLSDVIGSDLNALVFGLYPFLVFLVILALLFQILATASVRGRAQTFQKNAKFIVVLSGVGDFAHFEGSECFE
jgi:hypothetical protein